MIKITKYVNEEIKIVFYKYDSDSFLKYKLYINGYMRGKGLVSSINIYNDVIKSYHKTIP